MNSLATVKNVGSVLSCLFLVFNVMAQNVYTVETQRLPLENVVNARQLGGYKMADGSTIKRGLLLRGGGLAKATDQDLATLSEDFHVVHVFDFRTEGEVKHAPDRSLESADCVWMPTIDPNTEKLGTTNLPPEAYRNLVPYLIENVDNAKVQTIARYMYMMMIDNEYTQLQYAAFLQMLVKTESGAVYWHCSQGKDRTGLASMFVLAALGADRETIIADYALTNEFYSKELSEAFALMDEKRPDAGETGRNLVFAFLGAHVPYFEKMLDMIDEKYGSLLAYVQNQLMLSDSDIEILKSRYLE